MRRSSIREPLRMGISFGVTSGIITTLGLMVGLHSGTHSKPVVIGGVLTIAMADSLSDALGIHIAQESEDRHNTKEIWESTIATFVTKLAVAVSFLIPIALLSDTISIVVSVVWGLVLLIGLNIYLAKQKQVPAFTLVVEHLVIAILVIMLAYFLGTWIEAQVGMALSP